MAAISNGHVGREHPPVARITVRPQMEDGAGEVVRDYLGEARRRGRPISSFRRRPSASSTIRSIRSIVPSRPRRASLPIWSRRRSTCYGGDRAIGSRPKCRGNGPSAISFGRINWTSWPIARARRPCM